MVFIKIKHATSLLAVSSILLFFSCEQKNEKKHKKKDKQEETGNSDVTQNVKDSADTDAAACDSSIWKYVYGPHRA